MWNSTKIVGILNGVVHFATELLEKYKICKNVLKAVNRILSRIIFLEFTTDLVFNSRKSSSFGKNNV